MNYDLTKREYDCLLKMRRKDRDWKDIEKIIETTDREAVNIVLSDLRDLYYVVDSKPVTEGKLRLNQIGETVAQAEFDRRFDMYFTRVMSLAAVIISVAAIIVSLI